MDRSSILRASTNSYKQVEKCFYLLFYYIQIPRRIELYAGRGRKENALATQAGTRFPNGELSGNCDPEFALRPGRAFPPTAPSSATPKPMRSLSQNWVEEAQTKQQEVNMTAEDKAKNAGKVALVLEGGSFRGQFTAGVLDVLMEAGVEIPAVYGVSAGALNGVNYKSHQIGRANRINLAFCNDNRFMGAASFASTGSIASPIEMYAVATDMLFGTAAYLPVKSAVLDLDAVRASTSLPLVTPPVEIDGHKYVDGGVADSVPIEHVLEEAGFDRAVVIVTQDRSYEKKPYEFLPAARARYADYPYLLEAIETRHDRYNIQRMHLWKYEREGRALVVAPQKPVEVGHVEHDSAKLLDLYIQGRQEAKRLLAEIQEFVER